MNTTHINHNAFENLSLEEQINNDDNRPFFIERSESGLNPTLTADVDDMEAQRTSPYAFHFVNENLELHRDLFIVNNDDEDFEAGVERGEDAVRRICISLLADMFICILIVQKLR